MVHTIDWSLATLIAEDAYWGKPREWYIVKVRPKDGPKRYTRKVKGVYEVLSGFLQYSVLSLCAYI